MRSLLTFLEVADMLGCSKHTVERLAQDGTLPSIKIRRAIRFHPADVEEFIASQKASSGSKVSA